MEDEDDDYLDKEGMKEKSDNDDETQELSALNNNKSNNKSK